MAAATAAEGERAVELEPELEVAAILCDLKRITRARNRRWRRTMMRGCEEQAPVFPSWGRRRPRSAMEDGKPAERDRGAASPDTPLAFPDSAPEDEEDAAKRARVQAELVQEQRRAVASLTQENADLLKQIEEYRALLLSSRSTNESLKQLHEVRQQREEQARNVRVLALRPGLDLNAPAEDEAAAMARAAAQERYWQAQQHLNRAAATAEARRRRLGILRAKVASPMLSCRTRRVVG